MDNLLTPIILVVLVIFAVLLGYIFKLKNSQSYNNEDKQNSKKDSYNNVVIDSIEKPFDIQKQADFTNIAEIILNNSQGNALVFKRPSELSNDLYYEVIRDDISAVGTHVLQGITPILDKSYTLQEIAKQAPTGLFTTMADPASLSRFTDGTFTTMVRDFDNNLVSHEGFSPFKIEGKINPIALVNVGMQAMAAVSGQYYLHHINKELKSINHVLQNLIEFYHEEKVSILISAKNRIFEITKKRHVDDHDVEEIRRLHNRIVEVSVEYKTRLERQYVDAVGMKPKEWSVRKRVESYNRQINDLIYSFQVYFEADKLSLQTELAEIAVRMKINSRDLVLEDLYNQLKDNFKQSFSVNVDNHIKEYFDPIYENAKKIVANGKNFAIFFDESGDLLMYLSNKSIELENKLNVNDEILVIEQALTKRNEPQEIVVILDNENQNQRIFVRKDKME